MASYDKKYLLSCSYIVSLLYTDTCHMCPGGKHEQSSCLKGHQKKLILRPFKVPVTYNRKNLILKSLFIGSLKSCFQLKKALLHGVKLFETSRTLSILKHATFNRFCLYIELFSLKSMFLAKCFKKYPKAIIKNMLRVLNAPFFNKIEVKTACKPVATIVKRLFISTNTYRGVRFFITSCYTLSLYPLQFSFRFNYY